MAITRFGSASIRFMGLSSDTKPPMKSTNAGYLFFETNTGLWFVWTGTAWVAYTAPKTAP